MTSSANQEPNHQHCEEILPTREIGGTQATAGWWLWTTIFTFLFTSFLLVAAVATIFTIVCYFALPLPFTALLALATAFYLFAGGYLAWQALVKPPANSLQGKTPSRAFYASFGCLLGILNAFPLAFIWLLFASFMDGNVWLPHFSFVIALALTTLISSLLKDLGFDFVNAFFNTAYRSLETVSSL